MQAKEPCNSDVGGRVLEKALAQALVGQTAGDSGAEVILPADLTLLINPASEAITARRLKLALQNWSQPSPAIISVTSVGDTDTSTWWSLGMNAALLTKSRSYRPYSDGSHQKDYVVKTAGHSPILLDRQISRLDPQPPLPDEDATKWNFQHATKDQFRSANTWWRIQDAPPSSAPFIMNDKMARGYWVVSAPKEIIRDHNDIFNDSAIELFSALLKICRPTIQKSPGQKAITVPATIPLPPPLRCDKERAGWHGCRGAYAPPRVVFGDSPKTRFHSLKTSAVRTLLTSHPSFSPNIFRSVRKGLDRVLPSLHPSFSRSFFTHKNPPETFFWTAITRNELQTHY